MKNKSEKLNLVKKKEIFSKGSGSNLEPEDDPSELEWKDRFYNLSEREYTEKELKKKRNNIIKQDAPYDLQPELITQEKMQAQNTKEVYEENVEFSDKDNEEDLKLVLLDKDDDEPQVLSQFLLIE